MMTATIPTATATGRVVRVIGPVVDVEFARDTVPALFNALHVTVALGDNERMLTLEVAQHLGEDLIRPIPVTNPETKAFDYKVYDRVVRQFSNRSPTEFKTMQREELLAARLRDLVRSRVRVGGRKLRRPRPELARFNTRGPRAGTAPQACDRAHPEGRRRLVHGAREPPAAYGHRALQLPRRRALVG